MADTTLAEEFRRRLRERGKRVGMHTALLELREATETAVASVGGSETMTSREELAHDEGVKEGLHDLRERMDDLRRELGGELEDIRAAYSPWGVPELGP
jgi:hypothetical protein